MEKQLVWPERLALRDTKVYADEGQRIFTTATGYGYEKCEYVRADLYQLLESALERIGGGETFTFPFYANDNQEWRELSARMDFARETLAKLSGKKTNNFSNIPVQEEFKVGDIVECVAENERWVFGKMKIIKINKDAGYPYICINLKPKETEFCFSKEELRFAEESE